MCLWRQCNKDPSASLGMTVLGERIDSQGWCAARLEDGILVSQPSPLGEGAPQGRTGQTWYERQLGSTGKREAHLFCIRKHPSAADAVPLLREGKAYKVSQSPVIPLISGEWIVSHVWHEILRLSPYLFWLGLFTHGAFSSAQDDDTRGRKDSHLGDTLHVLELAVLYYDTSSLLEKGRAKGAGWIHEAM